MFGMLLSCSFVFVVVVDCLLLGKFPSKIEFILQTIRSMQTDTEMMRSMKSWMLKQKKYALNFWIQTIVSWLHIEISLITICTWSVRFEFLYCFFSGMPHTRTHAHMHARKQNHPIFLAGNYPINDFNVKKTHFLAST